MYPQVNLTAEESAIIFKIRQIIGDEPEVYVDDINNINSCSRIMASGTIYQLEEPKGYPIEIYVNGIEYTSITNPTVIGNKILKFSTPVLLPGYSITVIYNHFKHSDIEILDTYDTSAFMYLVQQCNLTPEELGIDLLILATSYILLLKDYNNYIKSAISLEDSDSRYDASRRPQYLGDLLKSISKDLQKAIEIKTKCKMLSLPVYKVE